MNPCRIRAHRRAPILAVLLCAALGGCGGGAPPGLSAVLITIDTTRADVLGAWGGPEGLTPNADALAAEGVVYAWARTVAPITLPAHASILTGLYPPRHTLRENNRSRLPHSARTLAEAAREQGLATGAFVAAVVLEPIFGLDQGFDVYEAPARPTDPKDLHIGERPGSEVVESALRWLDSLDPGQRYFLWVHMFEPHKPYEPSPEMLARGQGNPYLGEVATADQALGRLLDALRERGDLDRTLVVLAADHGEGLGQHDEATHTGFIYDSTVHVPLIVRHPDGWRAGERSLETVSVVDVYPTVCHALGLDPGGPVDGLNLDHATVPDDRGVYFESYYGYLNYGWAPLAGWAEAHAKYVHSARPELFDPRRDPQETQNLYRTAAETEPYRQALETCARPFLEPETIVPTEELRADLGALGYAGAAPAETELPSPLELGDRPVPRDRARELADYLAGLAYARSGQSDLAEPLLRGVLRDNRHHLAAKDALASLLVRTGQCEEAVELLTQLLRVDPDRATTHLNLASCLDRLGRTDEALDAYIRAAELDPGARDRRARVLQILRGRGEIQRAARLERLFREH